MLSELQIDNFAIIDHLKLNFNPGLIIFSGETGAGKSIIIDAVEAILGGKTDNTYVRAGSDRAYIEGVYQLTVLNEDIIELLKQEELLDSQSDLILSREIRLGGRNIARINGHSTNLNILRNIGQHLVDIHGQSEHLSLLKPSKHLELLDNFAKVKDLLLQYRETYHQYQKINHELVNLQKAERESARHLDMLKFQINEIESAHLKHGEEEELIAERNRLANAEAIASQIQSAIYAIDDGSPDTASAMDLIGQIVETLTSLSRIDPTQSKLAQQAQLIFDELSDLTHQLRLYSEGLEFNPTRLDQLEARLSQIYTLKKKYGDSIDEIIKFAADAKNQAESLTNAGERIQELLIRQENLIQRLHKVGLELSNQRHEDAELLSTYIEAELASLNMSKTQFRVAFTQQDDPEGIPLENGRIVAFHANGLEQVEFLIAPNPGEGLKPLVKIASGGETSRLMLALKHVLVAADHIPCLIFDEIDQGIGGRAGSIVGEKLWKLARQHQVFCVTHLPQLAAFADQHFSVRKEIHNNRTITVVEELDHEKRIIELSQMLGGISDGTIQSARELVENVRTITES